MISFFSYIFSLRALKMFHYLRSLKKINSPCIFFPYIMRCLLYLFVFFFGRRVLHKNFYKVNDLSFWEITLSGSVYLVVVFKSEKLHVCVPLSWSIVNIAPSSSTSFNMVGTPTLRPFT